MGTGGAAWNMDCLEESVKQRYRERYPDSWKRTWDSECGTVLASLHALSDTIGDRYERPEALGVGGTSVALKLEDAQLRGRTCVLKFPRPLKDRQDFLNRTIDEEVQNLARLRHASIIRVHERGRLDQTGQSYYIMDFVDGETSAKFLSGGPIPRATFVDLVEQTVDAVSYLHSRSLVHLDLKPENILVQKQGAVPVIADLGSARLVNPNAEKEEMTLVAFDARYADDRVVQRYRQSDPSDPLRLQAPVPVRELELKWDFAPLARTIIEWLGLNPWTGADKRDSSMVHLEAYDYKYLLLVAARLLGRLAPQWLLERIGLDREVLADVCYEHSHQVLTDLQKLSGKYSVVDRVPELNEYHPDTIKISSNGATTYTRLTKKVVEHPALGRLRSISQLGFLNQVFPTAGHTRFEHSLGTYHFAVQFVLSLYYDPLSPLFRQLMGDREIQALLLAAAVHDVGQFPLAHDLEEIDGFFSHRELTRLVLEQAVLATADRKRTGAWSPPDHLTTGLFEDRELGRRAVSILQATQGSSEPVRDRILHSIIDGAVDADKLDYLVRDSENLRIPYASGIDLERILRNLTVVITRPPDTNRVACVGVHEKARVAAESVAICRYYLFTQAYWHHSAASMKAMLGRAVLKLLSTGNLASQSRLRQRFWNLVLAMPESLVPDITPRGSETGKTKMTVSPTDAAVVSFFLRCLKRGRHPEAELLVDLLARRLYKRAFVYPFRSGENHWDDMVQSWDLLGTPSDKTRFLRNLELLLLQDKGLITGLGSRYASLQARVLAGKPVLLVNVPGQRQGANTLYYVLESERRSLRRDDRAVGNARSSEVWQEFGAGLRRKAGKVRVFCHPDWTDDLARLVEPERFADIFLRAASMVAREKYSAWPAHK